MCDMTHPCVLSASSIDVATDLDHITAVMVCVCVFVCLCKRQRECVCVSVCMCDVTHSCVI